MDSEPQASSEQLAVVDALSNCNALVNSVAGSGKTTTALHVARKYWNQKILLLTYNRRLKEETRNLAWIKGLLNLEVHSYHAMGYLYYNKNCFRDCGLREVVQNDSRPTIILTKYDIIIIDEAQDMTMLLFSFIQKLLRDIGENENYCPKLLLIGDINQEIFSFNNADNR